MKTLPLGPILKEGSLPFLRGSETAHLILIQTTPAPGVRPETDPAEHKCTPRESQPPKIVMTTTTTLLGDHLLLTLVPISGLDPDSALYIP